MKRMLFMVLIMASSKCMSETSIAAGGYAIMSNNEFIKLSEAKKKTALPMHKEMSIFDALKSDNITYFVKDDNVKLSSDIVGFTFEGIKNRGFSIYSLNLNKVNEGELLYRDDSLEEGDEYLTVGSAWPFYKKENDGRLVFYPKEQLIKGMYSISIDSARYIFSVE